MNENGHFFRALPDVERLSFRHHPRNSKLVAPTDCKTVVLFLVGRVGCGGFWGEQSMRDFETIVSKFPKSGHVRVGICCLRWSRDGPYGGDGECQNGAPDCHTDSHCDGAISVGLQKSHVVACPLWVVSKYFDF